MKDSYQIIRPGIFSGGSVCAFFTGVTPGADRRAIAGLLGIDERYVFFPVQRHTGRVIVLEDIGEKSPPEEADAVITALDGALVGVQVADCVPILLHDAKRDVVGAVHAGWRGTAEGILKNTIRQMKNTFGSRPEDILMAIGPAIGGCCYEVGVDVMEKVIERTGPGEYFTPESKSQKHQKPRLDLSRANMYQAASVGIPEGNIWLSGECTCCLPERFYSYRRESRPAKVEIGKSPERIKKRQGGFIGKAPRCP